MSVIEKAEDNFIDEVVVKHLDSVSANLDLNQYERLRVVLKNAYSR